MKTLKIMMVAIITIISSGCIDRYHVVHDPFLLGDICIFEHLTEPEKALMAEETKRKLGRNYKNCIAREDTETGRVEKHNELHKD